MSDNRQTVIHEMSELHPFGLANRADVYSPDTEDSPGAVFLARVRDDVTELLGDVDAESWDSLDQSDRIHEIADSAVPVYTGERWAVFADLGAWETDVSDLSGGGEDMTTLAGFALYEVAQTLTHSLITEAAGALEETEGDDVSSS